jgi:hypothetical protein
MAYIICSIPRLRACSSRQHTVTALQNLNRERVTSAGQAYARDRNVTNGTVLLHDLISNGYLQPGDVGSLGNQDATVYISTNEMYPQMFWIRMPGANGSDIVGLLDGSVQFSRR